MNAGDKVVCSVAAEGPVFCTRQCWRPGQEGFTSASDTALLHMPLNVPSSIYCFGLRWRSLQNVAPWIRQLDRYVGGWSCSTAKGSFASPCAAGPGSGRGVQSYALRSLSDLFGV
jgi:hypothetical protein